MELSERKIKFSVQIDREKLMPDRPLRRYRRTSWLFISALLSVRDGQMKNKDEWRVTAALAAPCKTVFRAV